MANLPANIIALILFFGELEPETIFSQDPASAFAVSLDGLWLRSPYRLSPIKIRYGLLKLPNQIDADKTIA